MNEATGKCKVECVAVSKRFGSKDALSPTSLKIDPGERVGIVGESGSGKSTLARIIVGLEKPSEGEVLIDGEPLSSLLANRTDRLAYRREVQLVAQDTTSTFDPRHTIRESLRLPVQILIGMDKSAADQAVDELLPELGVDPELLTRLPHELSGGQRQRMAIVRALSVRPRLLVCDEAVSALDVSVQAVVLNLLKRYSSKHGAGLLFVSHGLPATAFITERIIVMNEGRIVEAGDTEAVLCTPTEPFTRDLVNAYASET